MPSPSTISIPLARLLRTTTSMVCPFSVRTFIFSVFIGLCAPGLILPAAAGEPLLDLLQAVGTPERLVVDDDIRRAEGAAGYRLVHLGFHQVLDRRIVDRRAHFVRLQAEFGAHGDRV